MSSMDNENNGENDEIVDSEKEDSGDESNSDSPSSDEFESSGIDLDCDDSEKEKEFNSILADIEKQFNLVRDVYKKEKNYEIDTKINQIEDESAKEYQVPLSELKESKEVRIHIAQLVKHYRIKNLNQLYDADKLAAKQNYFNEKELLKDSIKRDIEEKIRKLNEERYKADSEFFSETYYIKKPRKYSYSDEYGEKRRKTVTISGPFIILRLKDEEIMEDVNFIKCCLRSQKNNYLHHY